METFYICLSFSNEHVIVCVYIIGIFSVARVACNDKENCLATHACHYCSILFLRMLGLGQFPAYFYYIQYQLIEFNMSIFLLANACTLPSSCIKVIFMTKIS